VNNDDLTIADIFPQAEFWLSGGKVILIFMLFFFTFVTMVGGNPQGDAYGFRYWQNGQAFQEYITTGSLGRFEGFLGALTSAVFTVVGPEYISIVAAEAMRPRIYIKAAFKMVYLRFGIFFIGGALFVGIACNSRWQQLEDVVNGNGAAGAAASPYVIAMGQLGISVLPDIVNA
jgi:amino acid transporter